MVSQARIHKSLKKSCEFLIKKQDKDGAWRTEAERYEYRLYQQPLILTSEAILALVFAIRPKYVKFIQRGLNFCFNERIDEKSTFDLHSWRFAVLSMSNSRRYIKESEKVKNTILSGQTKDGGWHTFPRTNMLTNFSVIQALKNQSCEKQFKRHIEWLKKSRTEDGIGWAFETNQKEAQVTFTAEAILNWIACGGSPTCKEIQTAKKFLEEKQSPEGYWSNVFENLPCAHTTSICALALMVSSEEPFNERVEKAIEFLLSKQTKEGYYIKYALHHIYYVHWLFSFYLFLKKYQNSNFVTNLKQHIREAEVISHLFRIFNEELKRNFQRAVYSSILNSRVLGTTKKAIARRREILRILDEEGVKTTAEIIDSLRELEEYRNLNKKSHLTQIKSDMDFLRSLNLIEENRYKYYSSFRVIE